LDGTSSEYRLVYDSVHKPDMGSYMIGVTQMIPNASRLKADYMNAMSSVEVENKNYTVNQLNALVKRIITNGLYLIKKKVATDNLFFRVYDQKHGDTLSV
jgi:hypothetical protein